MLIQIGDIAMSATVMLRKEYAHDLPRHMFLVGQIPYAVTRAALPVLKQRTYDANATPVRQSASTLRPLCW